jgi:hypothetical protein
LISEVGSCLFLGCLNFFPFFLPPLCSIRPLLMRKGVI